MFIEFHLLQNFAPSCLNRDDTNTPKDCTFGGHRRARISSQCIKRSVRRYFSEAQLISKENLAERSKRLIGDVAKALVEKGRTESDATALVKASLAAVKLSSEDNETQYLLFLGRQELQGLADVIHEQWDTLSPLLTTNEAAASVEGDKKAKKTAKQKKSEAKEAVPSDVAKKIKAVFNGGKAADLALFGRMLADQADLNVDAACQVAHALSSNKVSMEMDFYTAVDDLKERDADPGAGMMGTVEFNSSCFYRYANIDFDQLKRNLQDDTELARQTVRAFLEASIHAIPTGKQNSMAAHNPPTLVLAVVRDRGLWSLANAFEKPVRPGHDQGLVHNSVRELDRYWGRLTKMYGERGIHVVKLAVDEEKPDLESLKANRVSGVAEVIDSVLNALPGGKGAA